MTGVPTYYVPSGREHALQTDNVPAEIEVPRRALAGLHTHTWSKDSGLMCVSGMEPVESDGRIVQVPRMDEVERGKPCSLGDKERF